jgi:hypothetical protein
MPQYKAFENLSMQISGMLETLISDHGWSLPIYCVSVSSNGFILAVHFNEPGHAGKVVAEHLHGDHFPLPIHCMLVNSGDGRAAKVVIEQGISRPTFTMN